jgi:hypothetical protein
MKKIGILLISCLVLGFGMQISAEEFTDAEKWYSYNDKDSGGNSTISITTGQETIGGQSYFVVSMTGKVTTKYQYGYIGFGNNLDVNTMAKLKAASGIKFKAVGDGKSYRFRIETTPVKDSDYHGKVFSTKNGQVVEVFIPYKDLRQEGWGTARGGFQKDKLTKIGFQTVGQPHSSISLKIFDFELIL